LNEEFGKIKFYFSEGAKFWSRQSDFVVSRDFYLLWENIQQPRPFKVESNLIDLFDQKFQLNGEPDENRIGYFHWDEAEMSAALTVESPSWQSKYLLTFDNGAPRIYETDPQMQEQSELTHGEKLEITLDIIAYYRENAPGKDILDLSKKDYQAAIDSLSSRYDPLVLKAIRRLPAASLKKLLAEAIEDMTPDEISDQLSLPLDGAYISPIESAKQAEVSGKTSSSTILPMTAWRTLQLMEFIAAACHKTFEAEKFYILSFRDTTFIGKPENDEITVRLIPDEQQLIQEGDQLTVYCHGEREPVGTFRADLYDGQAIYGRLKCRDLGNIEDPKNRLFAKPRKSPREYLYLSMEALSSRFRQNDGRGITGALRAVLGMEQSSCRLSYNDKAPAELDISQRKAWSSAIDKDNPVVLIQGPPGTGKTRVLEAVVRELCARKLRILVAAPSNTAVDNICRRVADLPVLRFGRNQESIAPDIVQSCWIGRDENIKTFLGTKQRIGGGSIYLGTHVALLRDDLIEKDIEQNGQFDVMIFDEAGMASLQEFLLSASLSKRVVLFGDHQQLPPFPLPAPVVARLEAENGPVPAGNWKAVTRSALEWLANQRQFPVIMLQSSYRCQNPRLLRFASTLFYDAGVKPSSSAEYYQLPYHERMQKYPAATLRLIRTSHLPVEMKREKLILEGAKPGLENRLEAALCCEEVYQAMARYPLNEICVITPYRRQLRLIRDGLHRRQAETIIKRSINAREWENFLFTRIATVDSFQGSESDVVIISYVRSPEENGIGFVDDANRINVAHTRCRREMAVIGDLASLQANARNNIFQRMERAFVRDGIVSEPLEAEATVLLEKYFPAPAASALTPDQSTSNK